MVQMSEIDITLSLCETAVNYDGESPETDGQFANHVL